ncbi:hypothetical protein Hte_005855 [Hypoxylon texense]
MASNSLSGSLALSTRDLYDYLVHELMGATEWHPFLPPMSAKEGDMVEPRLPRKIDIDFEAQIPLYARTLIPVPPGDKMGLALRFIATRVLVQLNGILKRRLRLFLRSKGQHATASEANITRDDQKAIMERVKEMSLADLADCISVVNSMLEKHMENDEGKTAEEAKYEDAEFWSNFRLSLSFQLDMLTPHIS